MAMISTGLGLAEKANLELCFPVCEALFSFLAQADDFGGDELVQVNWIEEITKGGITMIFIGLLSVIGVAILIERLFSVRRSRLLSQEALNGIQQMSESNDGGKSLFQITKGKNDLLSQSINFVLRRRKNPYAVVKDAVADFAGREVRGHLARVQLLAAVAGIAPLLGLLGTMVGMIESFKLVSVYGDEGGASILADSISKALITTAAGLVVAIPTLGAFYWMKHRVHGIATELEVAVERVINMVYLSESTARKSPSQPKKPADSTEPDKVSQNSKKVKNGVEQ